MSKQDERSQNRGLWLLVLISAVFTALYIFYAAHKASIYTADSESYIHFLSDRPPGYPALIALVHLFGGSDWAVIVVQNILLGISYCFLSSVVARFTGRLWIGALFCVALFANPFEMGETSRLMSEALGLAVMAGALGFLILYVRSPSLGRLCAVLLLLMMGMLVRPIGLVFFIALALLLVLQLDQTRKRRLAGIGLVIIAICATASISHLSHAIMGQKESSPLARGLLQRAIFMAPDPAQPQTDCEAEKFDALAAPVRRYIEEAPPEMRRFLDLIYSDYLRFGVILPYLAQNHQPTDEVVMCYSLARIKQHPAPFLASWAREFYAGLVAEPHIPPFAAPAFAVYLQAHEPPTPTLDGVPAPAFKGQAQIEGALSTRYPAIQAALDWMLLLPPILMLVGVFAAMMLWMRGRSSPTLALSVFCGAAYYGAAALTAVSEYFLIRYWVYSWPLLCGALFFSALSFRHQQHAETGDLLS